MARPTLESSVKFKLLVSRLDLPRPFVRGLLETMWDVCHATGDPILGTEEAVEAAAEWPGEKGEFFRALQNGLWIEKAEDGRWMIHDYWQHCPDYVMDRLRKELGRRGVQITREDIRTEAATHPEKLRERLITSRTRPGKSGTVQDDPGISSAPAPAPAPQEGCASNGSHSARAPKKPKKRSDKDAIRAYATATGFDGWWQKYPNKKSRIDAERAWTFDLGEEVRSKLAQLTIDFLDRRTASQTSGEWVPGLPLGGTFLRNERWNDEFHVRDSDADDHTLDLKKQWAREDEARVFPEGLQ